MNLLTHSSASLNLSLADRALLNCREAKQLEDAGEYEQAREALGTRGYTDTINGALREVVRRSALQRAADLVRGGKLNLITPDEVAELRKPRTEA